MNQTAPKTEDFQSPLDAPARPELRWIRWCLILFLLSAAAICRLPSAGVEGESAGGMRLPLAPLAIALVSGGIALLLGLRHLFIRPGARLILLWFGFLVLTATYGFLRGEEPVALIRTLIPPLLLGLGITTTHVAACAGMRATEAIRYLLIAAGCGLFFQFGLEILADRLQQREMNFEALTPLLGFLVAWAVCALFLRRAINRTILWMAGLAIAAAALGIFRGMLYPVVIPAAGAGGALILGITWRLFPQGQSWKRFAPIGILALLGVIQLALPVFNNSPSSSESLPEFSLISFFASPPSESARDLFGILIVSAMVLITMGMSLRAAWRISDTVMGRWASDAHLMFLPFVALPCLFGGYLAGSPLEQPFTVVLTGALVAMPQFFFNRAFYLRHRENEAAITPQLILSEEDLSDTWEGAFPSNA